jgi:putative tricarboxylic transport membrane protein
MTTDDRGPRPAPAPAAGIVGPRIVAAVLLVASLLLIVSALGIARGGGFTVISPATIPLAIVIGLAVLSAALLARTTISVDIDLAEHAALEERVTHWPTVGLAAAALVVYALALDGMRLGDIEIPGLGFVVATAAFLPITARILGSRAWVRDIVAGLGLALVLYFGFTEYLGIRLPAGLLGLVL